MKTALVVGSARCVWDDLNQALALAPDAVVLAVNLGVVIPPRVDHIVSAHAMFVGPLKELRAQLDVREDKFERPLGHARREAPGVDHVWPERAWRQGTSSRFAACVALALGADRVILCGVPLDSSPRYHDDPSKPVRWQYASADGTTTKVAWEKCYSDFKGRVFSYSGWTHELLGAPAPEGDPR